LARLQTPNQTRKRLQPGSVGAKTSNKASGLSGPSSGWPEPGSLARPSRAGISNTPYITWFIIQCAEVGNIDALKIRLFSSSLSGPAFSWFTSLSANSIIKWSDLEQQFLNYFFSGIHETKITNLTRLKQRNDETVARFV
jgi:hypothetical protein